jgi:hypothetical protein
MATKTTNLEVSVEYDADVTDPEGIASALDRLMETALSTPDILVEYGNPHVGQFFVAAEPGSQLERWAFYDPEQQTMLTTQTFASYEEATDAVPATAEVLIVKFIFCTIGAGEDLADEENNDG